MPCYWGKQWPLSLPPPLFFFLNEYSLFKYLFREATCQQYRFGISKKELVLMPLSGSPGLTLLYPFLRISIIRTLDGQFLFVLECLLHLKIYSISRPCPLIPVAAVVIATFKKSLHLFPNVSQLPVTTAYWCWTNMMLCCYKLSSWSSEVCGIPGVT